MDAFLTANIISGTITNCGDIPRHFLSIDDSKPLVLRIPFDTVSGEFVKIIDVKCPRCVNVVTGNHKKLLEHGVINGSQITILCTKCKGRVVSEIKFSSDTVSHYDKLK